ncbi:MAG TPA: hypothetical protein VGI03_09315 [Verrucomicrobiae bacterium]|jgi:hypothetical protein
MTILDGNMFNVIFLQMEIHGVLKIAGGVGTLLMFIPMTLEVIKHNGDGQSFSTWLLWAMLDSILAASTMVRHGNFLLPLGYAIGGWILTALLVMKGRFAWGRLDNVVLVLVIACVAGWRLGGARAAIIFATLATVIATLPGFIELWRHPQRSVGNVWMGFVLTNALSFAGGTAMTVEERFSPAIFAILSLFMVIASRKPAITKH